MERCDGDILHTNWNERDGDESDLRAASNTIHQPSVGCDELIHLSGYDEHISHGQRF